jgi:hypothetical protein
VLTVMAGSVLFQLSKNNGLRAVNVGRAHDGLLEFTYDDNQTGKAFPGKLRALASAAPPCISIGILESEARDARAAFNDALAQIRAKLAASTSKHDVASLLDPLELAATNVIDSSEEPVTFIFLRSPDVCESFRTRYLVGQPVAAVGECFRLRPLLALASKHLEFHSRFKAE